MTAKIGGFQKECPTCSATQTYSYAVDYKRAVAKDSKCRSCSTKGNSNSRPNKRSLFELIPNSWFNSKAASAVTRGIEWDLTIEFLWNLYQMQEGLCALSGEPIEWGIKTHTVSIDRIDSDRGYTEDNVQLVHKDVNFMKGTLSEERFLELCEKITNNY
jgi:hypothetical protein